MTRFAALLASVALLVTVCSSMAAAGDSAGKFTVRSTIDGKKALPHRIHWIARPSLPESQVESVSFSIDGKIDWIEHHAPYVYSDNEGSHRGYLVTSWLSPGKHRFTVRAVSTSNAIAVDTVVARVLPSPAPPAALAGTWTREIPDTSAAPRPKSAGNPTETLTPPGTYAITFEQRWIHDVFPCDTSPCRYNEKTGGGGEFVSDWTPGATTFQVRGPVTFRVFHDTDRLAGWWCWMDGPAATYAWTVSGDTLTLTPVGDTDACAIRGFVWTGEWKRAG